MHRRNNIVKDTQQNNGRDAWADESVCTVDVNMEAKFDNATPYRDSCVHSESSRRNRVPSRCNRPRSTRRT